MKHQNENEIIEENEEIGEVERIRGKKRFFAGLGLFCLAFIFLILCVVFQDSSLLWLNSFLGVGMVIFGVVALILLIKNFPYVILDEAIKMDKKYENKELQKLLLSNMNDMKQKLLENKFKLQEDGWFFKKEFSALKDSVSYCVRFTESNDIEKMVEWQLDHIDMDTKKGTNFCLIIFAYMDTITEEVKATVKDYGINMIVSENALDPQKQMTLILVAVDKVTAEGWYMDIGNKHKVSLYTHGCRLIKKIFDE